MIIESRNDVAERGMKSIAKTRQVPLLSIMCGNRGIDWNAVDNVFNSLRDTKLPKMDLLVQAHDSEFAVITQLLEIFDKYVDEMNVIIPAPLGRSATLLALASHSITVGTFGSISPITSGYNPSDSDDTLFSHRLARGHIVKNKLNFDAVEEMQRRIVNISGDNISIKESWEIAANFVSATNDDFNDEKTAIDYDLINSTIAGVKKALDTGDCVTGDHFEVAQKLVTGYTNPNYLIRFEELKSLGFNVIRADDDLDSTLYELSVQPDEISSSEVIFIGLEDIN